MIPEKADGREEVIELSPFIVSEQRGTGYQATRTLAGNRLVTDVKDIGSSISIYTKEFLNDIGAKNAQDVLIYAPGMDAGGPGGNYSAATSDLNGTNATSESRQQPQQSRTRGLAGPNYTRGFFNSNITIDAYNTDTVTVNRGPNAILFGVGSPAGVVDTTLIQAKLKKNEYKVEYRFGDNGSSRANIDVNQVIIPDRVALRLAALDDREEFDQRPAFDYKKRLYGAFLAKPFRNTTVRGSFESGNGNSRRPQTVLPYDAVTPWLTHGKNIWDPSFYDDPSRNPDAAITPSGRTGTSNQVNLVDAPYGLSNGNGRLMDANQIYDQILIIFSDPSNPIPAAAMRSSIPVTTSTAAAANAIRNNLFHPLVNKDSANDLFQFVGSTPNTLLGLAYWQTVFPGITALPPGIKTQGFTDYSIWDFRTKMLDQTFRQTDSFRTYNFTIEQLGWGNRLGIEAAYNRESTKGSIKNLWLGTQNSNFISIDTTAVLPNGQANPNLGRPYVVSRSSYRKTFTENEDMRLTGFLKYDFRDMSRGWGKWLGEHTLTGLYQESAAEKLTNDQRLRVMGEAADAITTNIASSALIPSYVAYIGPSVLTGPFTLNAPITIPTPDVGMAFPTTYFAAAAGSPLQGDFKTVTTTMGLVSTGGNNIAQREVIKSKAINLHSRWLNNLLITTVGWRRDEDYVAQQAFTSLSTSGTYFARPPSFQQTEFTLDDFNFPRTPPRNVAKEIKTYSAVLRVPQKMLHLPQGTDFSVFYNSSENFTPAAGRVDPYGNALSSPVGVTKEYGFNLSFFNDKLMIRASRFETSVQNQQIDNLVERTIFINGINAHWQQWSQEVNNNNRVGGAIDRKDEIATLLSALPANYTERYQYKITGSVPTLKAEFLAGQIGGTTDTTDYVAKGTEIEATYAPNQQWRFMANFAHQETVQSNTGPGATELLNRMKAAFDKLANVPNGQYPELNADGSYYVFGQPLPAGTFTFGQWLETNVYVPYATMKAAEGSASAEQRKYRANFVGNYTFPQTSKFRGFNMGVGVRWQSKYALGYPTTRNTNGSIKIDIDNPYYGPDETNIDGWVGYQKKICGDRIIWKLQLNARNIAASKDPIAVTVQPWGQTAIARLPAEQRWYVTNTFTF